MNENTNFLDGFNGIGGIILILLFFIMFGGGMWGNRYGVDNQINSDFLYRDIQGVNNNVLENRFHNAEQTNALQAQIANCCCENRLAIANQTNTLQAQMVANTQAILDKMCATEVQNLRDALAQEQRANLTNTLVASNQTQTQNILNSLGQYYPLPPVNPYVAYNTCSNV